MNVLFLCGRNELRSPTAEALFADWPGVETLSAGLNPDCDNLVTRDDVAWADVVFVMERRQRAKLTSRFGRELRGKRVVCLDVADRYALMEPALVELLTARVVPHLPRR